MNEKPLVMRMRENYKYFGGLSFVYGLIFAFCLYKNMSGITFPICVIVTIVFAVLFMKKINFKLQRHSIPYIAGMVLLGISTAMTTSFFLHFFNLLGIILLFFVFMIHQFYNDRSWNFPAYLERIFILFGTTIESIPLFYRHGTGHMKGEKERKNSRILAVVIGIAVALAVLSVTLPLLLRSDIIFAKMFGEILKYINLGTILGVTFTVIIGFTFCYAFFGALCKYNFPEGKGRKLKYYDPVIGITFTSIVSAVYLIYCVVQIMYLFVGLQAGLPENVTYSEYARRGFWELLFVSIINFVMVLICMYIFQENIVLKIILTVISGCTFIMMISAAYRMILYVSAYHLTFLRILVLWFLIVLTLIMAGVVVSIYRKRFPLFHFIMAVVSVMYIGLSLSRPDTLVVKYNIAHMDEINSNDFYYMMFETSLDTVPYLAEIDLEKLDGYDEYVQESAENFFKGISEDSEGIYFRKANYSRIRAKIAADKWLENHQ